MKKLFAALVYTGLSLGANPAMADMSDIAALREEDMKKLVFHAAPKPITDASYETFDGGAGQLSDYAGQYVLLNFWATWCAPCRKEMPDLAELQTEFGGEDFQVVTVATGRNPPAKMKDFFAKIGVDNLPLHRDPKQQLARQMAVLGLPITVLIDPDGNEIARLRGDAHWASDSAKTLIRALIDPPES